MFFKLQDWIKANGGAIENPLTHGEYVITFRFPGLCNQVRKDQLYQGIGRICLGDIFLNEKGTIK